MVNSKLGAGSKQVNSIEFCLEDGTAKYYKQSLMEDKPILKFPHRSQMPYDH